MDQVVVIEEEENLAARPREPRVARGTRPARLVVPHELDHRRETGKACYGGWVARPVVHDDDLRDRPGLGQHGPQRRLGEFRPVPRRQDDADGGGHPNERARYTARRACQRTRSASGAGGGRWRRAITLYVVSMRATRFSLMQPALNAEKSRRRRDDPR